MHTSSSQVLLVLAGVALLVAFSQAGGPRHKIIRFISGPSGRKPGTTYHLIPASTRHHPKRQHFGRGGHGGGGGFKPSLADCAKQGDWKPIIGPSLHLDHFHNPTFHEHVHHVPTFHESKEVAKSHVQVVHEPQRLVHEKPAWPMPGTSPDLTGNSVHLASPPWWKDLADNDNFFKSGPSSPSGQQPEELAGVEYPGAGPGNFKQTSREYAVHEKVEDVPPPKQRPRGGQQLLPSIVPSSTTPPPPPTPPANFRPNHFRRRRQKSARTESAAPKN